MPWSVLKVAKAVAGATKIQRAILSCCWCLAARAGVPSGFDCSYLRIEHQEQSASVGIAAQPAVEHPDGSQDFFFRQTKFWLAGQVSHFGSGMFGELDKWWREFEVVVAFEPFNRTNRTKTDSVLGTMWSPSYRLKCYRLNINFE